ncbi:MAG: hypothetical protein GX593_14050, partial [Actinomycetales bacterium]|nr:hypothetical protein [Actinomycetales bacterium]
MNPVPALADALAVVRSIMGGTTDIGAGDEVVSQRDRVEAIRLLEDLKDAACAAQAELAVAVVAHEVAVAEAVADDVDVDAECASRAKARRVARARRSAIGQVALARRESPHMGGVFVGMGEALVHEMPCTFAALKSGALNEYRARTLVRETACLS